MKMNWTAVSVASTAVVALWGAYTAYQVQKFQQPFDKHAALVISFRNQIDSAIERQDDKEVSRIRVAYESFEENWRAGQIVADLVQQAFKLDSSQISESVRETTTVWLLGVEKDQSLGIGFSSQFLGDAWFVAGDYRKALVNYKSAESHEADNPLIYARQSRSYWELWRSEEDSDTAVKWRNSMNATWSKATSLGSGVIAFAWDGDAPELSIVKRPEED